MAAIIKNDLPKIVQEAGEIKLHGTIIDDGWFQHLRFDNGEPNMIAILILSEVFYWYRPTVIKDEASGNVVEIKKKYHTDKLQKDYKSLGEKFGVSKRTAQNACYFLRDRELITIEHRTVRAIVKGKKTNLPNITFLEPVLKNIRKISCMCEEYSDPADITFKSDIHVTFKSDTLHRLSSTKIINTNPSISLSISPFAVTAEKTDDGLTDGLEHILGKIDWDYLEQQKIPQNFVLDVQRTIEHLWYRESYLIDGAALPKKVVQKTLGQINHFCIEFAYNQYSEYTRKGEVTNQTAYLRAILFNSVHEGLAMIAHRNYNVFGNGRKN